MRVALIQYWLVAMRGGEKVLEALCEIFPQADIFTHVYIPEAVSPTIRQHRIITSFIQRLPFAGKLYRKYLPLMPLALEQLDLRDYDLVISLESGPAKGVITGADTLHVCYCHTPMRYLWDFYQNYLAESNLVVRTFFRFFAGRLRVWDVLSAQRVDFFAANSVNVARRIAKYYRREAKVIFPPVDVEFFAPPDGVAPAMEDYYLFVGQLNAYKRADLAVKACSQTGRKLLVVGEGPERIRLERMAGSTVTFAGRQNDEFLRHKLQRCKALLFPGEEDFGIVPVEALAAGRPVIAFGRGGVLETVVHKRSGILFSEQTVNCLIRAIEDHEAGAYSFDGATLTADAGRFEKAAFLKNFAKFMDDCLAAKKQKVFL
ncbi:MAG: glycosyltransferase [Desulfovibrio sp.]|jgi:glycosyltransferase involved in cell wall biosynthesis|nr:glycosyltransferase [Desulfovibrio sp.]